ncbi:uncharacterized protein LOC115879566 [Sitophilus oryzae]|uniref:Uncharacterized protein LOC115879566 n=1 Tax=Sitophilus oryzae TaxID=7048 RepID=A0A6J2XMN6_SITOR|nr:uncharacterized protein LOC115879566 [Sitophilus oryzae]
MVGKVSSFEFGMYKIESSTVSNKFYVVSHNEICDDNCRAVYCNKCKVCIHRYTCQCPEYLVKTAMCKHIHAGATFEQRSESVSGSIDSQEDNNLYLEQPASTSQYNNELDHFIQEREVNDDLYVDNERRREIILQEMCNDIRSYGSNLNNNEFEQFVVRFADFKSLSHKQY